MKRDKDDFGPLLTPTEFMATLPQFPDTDMADWLLSLMTENYHTERQFWSLIKAEADKRLGLPTPHGRT